MVNFLHALQGKLERYGFYPMFNSGLIFIVHVGHFAGTTGTLYQNLEKRRLLS